MRTLCRLSLLVASTAALVASYPMQAKTHERAHTKKEAAIGAPTAKNMQTPSTSAEPMMRMPLVLPLFVQDEHFTSTVVLVNGSVESTYADVALTGLDGKEINHRRVGFTPHSERSVEVKELLQEVASPATMGRITIMQSPELKGMAIATQLSITYQGSRQPTYIDEETAMPSTEGSQVLRAVADRATGSPIVTVTSLAGKAQYITMECVSETGVTASTAIELGPGQTIVGQACQNRTVQDADFEGVSTDLEDKPERAVGIALTSDGLPGSFAAFALAPHKKGKDRYFSAVNFSDPKTVGSKVIFTGVPLWSSSLLPEGKYVPQVALTNFSARALRVQIQYGTTISDVPSTQTIEDLTLPPRSAKQVTLGNLQGAPGLQNSFVISSDGSSGDLMAKIVSTSDSSLREVEVLGKDEKSGNGGSHPWSLEQGNEATLLLFNPAPDSQAFTVLISAGDLFWEKTYHLASMQTQQISLRDLILNTVADDKSKTLPADSQTGLVEWFGGGGGKGRLLESNKELLMARNFSCTGYYCLCQPSFLPDVTLFGTTSTVNFGSRQANICQSPSPGPCCNQGSVAQQNTQSATYSWSSGNTNIIQISGLSTGASVNTYGVSGGSTPVDGQMTYSGCTVSTAPPANVCDFIIDPSAGFTATYCDDINANIQNFNLRVTLSSPSSCASNVNCSASKCTASGSGQVSIDQTNSYFFCSDTSAPYCHVQFRASGSSGQKAGTVDIEATVKYSLNETGVRHTASNPVTCP